jgi:ATP synthase protein I
MGEDKGTEGSFEARLQRARGRHGMDKPEPQKSAAPTGPSSLGVGMRVGVELVSALVVAVAIGWGLDHWLHTLPLFLVLFVLLGGAAGVLNVWRVVSPASRPDQSGTVQ